MGGCYSDYDQGGSLRERLLEVYIVANQLVTMTGFRFLVLRYD